MQIPLCSHTKTLLKIRVNISSSSQNLFPTGRDFTRVLKIREINSTGKQISIERETQREDALSFFLSLMDWFCKLLKATMSRSKNFFQNLIKPFKLGSSRGNEQNPVLIFAYALRFAMFLTMI
jgi:hypothetical protein